MATRGCLREFPGPPCLPLLESCTTTPRLDQILARTIVSGLFSHRAAAKFLACCARAESPDPARARLLFDQLPCPGTSSWNALFRAHAKAVGPNHAVALLKEMLRRGGARPSGLAFSYVLAACAALGDLRPVTGVNAQVVRLGLHSDAFLLNWLVRAYVLCGSLDSARRLLDEMPERDLISWTVLINGYIRENRAKEATELFFLMVEEGVRPDEVTLVAMFTLCSQLGNLELGKRLESSMSKMGVQSNVYVVNSLINLYAKCGRIDDAQKLFDAAVEKDVVSWNSLVSGYVRSGDMKTARRLFELIPNKNKVSWSLLINGYVQNGDFKEALQVFHEMRSLGLALNDAALTGIVTACAHLGILDLGKKIHLSLDENVVQSDSVLSTALVDMYVKCGCLEDSLSLFRRIVKKSLVSWNVMIMGMAIHGKVSECIELFHEMLQQGLKPDGGTFAGVLSGCAHAGWVGVGKAFFDSMTSIYGVIPQAEHYSCMVHLMGRAGLVDEAYKFIKASPVQPDVVMWGALLSACNIHGNIELGNFATKQMLELDNFHTGAYLQLSSIYASANKWDEVLIVRNMMKEKELKNCPGWSWIELDGIIHEFYVGQDSHPQMKEILSVLHAINAQLSFFYLLMHSQKSQTISDIFSSRGGLKIMS